MGKVKDFDELEEYEDLDSESENNKNYCFLFTFSVFYIWKYI